MRRGVIQETRVSCRLKGASFSSYFWRSLKEIESWEQVGEMCEEGEVGSGGGAAPPVW